LVPLRATVTRSANKLQSVCLVLHGDARRDGLETFSGPFGVAPTRASARTWAASPFAISISTERSPTSTGTWACIWSWRGAIGRSGDDVGQAIVFRGLPTQTTKNDRLRHPVRVDSHAGPEDSEA
jgi:hypothetical protein